MGRPVAYDGAQIRVVYAVASGECPGQRFYHSLSDRDKAKVNKLFQWLGDHGWINNEEKFKRIEGTEFFEFKSFQIRMPCFRSGSTYIITHGFIKKSGPIRAEEIDKARRIKGLDSSTVIEKGLRLR